ncbi:DUF5709 domain-containing protein [Tessaracoccus antarcticus]|uniref:DUF5709 domain-containing protein n=1 Tax=Tessaracoccus antarcticus TaxID=2479848 RepID=A0A3M0G4Z4_9ACTN|nr:DUF5709 domain-containing protein [Tessaracoccus antarcticus]RMB59945.1 hypothetical protein EAX62_09455 [Tessaracoccus antarcticus]
MSDTADFDTPVPDESEQLDQIQEADSLIDRGVEDVLDEGYTAPEQWSAAQGFGNTPEEMRQGETINQRIKQEEPEKKASDVEWNASKEDREVGGERAGRLMRVQGPGGEATLGTDVGFSGGAASAEEAAMHIISEDEDEELDA